MPLIVLYHGRQTGDVCLSFLYTDFLTADCSRHLFFCLVQFLFLQRLHFIRILQRMMYTPAYRTRHALLQFLAKFHNFRRQQFIQPFGFCFQLFQTLFFRLQSRFVTFRQLLVGLLLLYRCFPIRQEIDDERYIGNQYGILIAFCEPHRYSLFLFLIIIKLQRTVFNGLLHLNPAPAE